MLNGNADWKIQYNSDTVSLTSPRQLCRIELDDIIVNRSARGHEFASHRHKESVECIDRGLALYLDHTAVEASSELDLNVQMINFQ